MVKPEGEKVPPFWELVVMVVEDGKCNIIFRNIVKIFHNYLACSTYLPSKSKDLFAMEHLLFFDKV